MGEIETKVQDVPYLVHESELARIESIHKRIEEHHKRIQTWLFGIIVGLILLLVGSNVGWLVYEAQYVEEETNIEATQDGSINIVGAGDVTYGTESQDNH